MDLNTLRDIIEKDEGKIFVYEEGKPLLVLMNFDVYKRLLKNNFRENNKGKTEEKNLIDLISKKEEKKEIQENQEEMTDAGGGLEIDDLNL
jgi:hypothetical protein